AGVETHCIAGGTHLDPLFGRSIDGFRDIRGLKVTPAEQTWPGDAPQAVAQFAGSATEAFGRALATVDPDLVIVLGDRIEMLAATLAAVPARIPIAHLHGGERTLGAYDDK